MYSPLLFLVSGFGAAFAFECYSGQNGKYGKIICPGDKCAAVKFETHQREMIYQLRCFNDFKRFPISSFIDCPDGDAKTPAECETVLSFERTPQNYRNTLADRAEQTWGAAVKNMGYQTFCCCSGSGCNSPLNKEIREFIPELISEPTPRPPRPNTTQYIPWREPTTEYPIESGCLKLAIHSIALCFVLFVGFF